MSGCAARSASRGGPIVEPPRFNIGDRVWFRLNKLWSGTVTHIDVVRGRTRFFVRYDNGQKVLYRSHIIRRMTPAEIDQRRWIDTPGAY